MLLNLISYFGYSIPGKSAKGAVYGIEAQDSTQGLPSYKPALRFGAFGNHACTRNLEQRK